jgi:protein-tyrosine phosphatase
MGNICRSPLLEGWAQQAVQTVPQPRHALIDSAGTGRWHVGQPPDARAIAAAARQGVDISAQRARAVVSDDFTRFDLMLCADRANLAWLESHAPAGTRACIALALDWTGVGRDQEVPDPYYGPVEGFDHVCRLAQSAAAGLLQRLRAQA